MTGRITTFLMFEGKAEEAMNFYTALFPDSEVEKISRYGQEEAGAAGRVKHAIMRLGQERYMCIDSPVEHGFRFNPAVSLFVDCDTPDEVSRLFDALSESGEILMPLDAYPFAQSFAWINDRFGLSWQLFCGLRR